MKEHTADSLIPHERVIILVFDINRGWWAMSPSTGNFRLKWPTPFPLKKRWLRPISAYNDWTVRAREKCSIIKSGNRPRAFQRATDEVRTLPLTPPKGGSKSKFVVFVNKIKVQSNKICYTVSLCENFQRHSCSRTIPLSNSVGAKRNTST